MTGTPSADATYYRPAEVAAILRCSEWWVKEQARRRRIPYCWIGGSYLFTSEHVAEILRLFEVRPADLVTPASPVRPTSPHPGSGVSPAGGLRARTPRRTRNAVGTTPAAA